MPYYAAAEETTIEPRNLVVEEDHVAVGAIERRKAILAPGVVEVLRNLRASRCDRRDAERFIIVAQVLAVSVVESNQQAAAQAPVNLHVTSIVVADRA